jgi:hypothetical protein
MHKVILACDVLDHFSTDRVPVEENSAAMRHPSSRNSAGQIKKTKKYPKNTFLVGKRSTKGLSMSL